MLWLFRSVFRLANSKFTPLIIFFMIMGPGPAFLGLICMIGDPVCKVVLTFIVFYLTPCVLNPFSIIFLVIVLGVALGAAGIMAPVSKGFQIGVVSHIAPDNKTREIVTKNIIEQSDCSPGDEIVCTVSLLFAALHIACIGTCVIASTLYDVFYVVIRRMC